MTSITTPWAGTASTFQAVVDDLLANYSDLRRYLCGRLRNPDDAADIAQSSFAQAYAHALNAPVLNARALLFQAARNLCIDQYRRRELERAYLASIEALPQQEVPSAESRLLILDALERIDRMLDQLKPRVRQAFLFAQLDGLTCTQIAEKLGVSRATVERDLAKALQHCYRLRYVEG